VEKGDDPVVEMQQPQGFIFSCVLHTRSYQSVDRPVEEDAHLPEKHPSNVPALYDSVVTFALAFVTLTDNCFALATMSTRFRAETP